MQSRSIPFRRRAAALVLAAAALACGAGPASAQQPPDPSADRSAVGVKGEAPSTQDGIIPGEFIVQVDKGRDPEKLAGEEGVKPKFVYRHALNGFAGQLDDKQRAKLERHPHVKTVEPSRRVTGDATQPMNTWGDPWGLDRLDQRYLPFSRNYTYTATGSGVHAYIIDSGINTSHPEFGGRAYARFDAYGSNAQDCHGHGTHVAGTVGGATVGVAKRVWLHSVRVLDCYNNGTSAGIVAGINWVARYHAKPAVANISIGTRGGPDSAIVTATNALANAGVFVAAAAGNDNKDACQSSPANAAGALTVAASDSTDNRAGYSNWGTCVDVYGPGSNILSASHRGGNRYDSGTSMATPHVSGLVALGKSWWGDGYTSAVWGDWVKSNATPNVIRYNGSTTPNRLVYKGGNF